MMKISAKSGCEEKTDLVGFDFAFDFLMDMVIVKGFHWIP